MLLNYITFKAPQILLLFPILVGILIYIYIKFYSNKKIIFPSFFLLENYTNNNKSGIKIRLPFRFFYELLILFIFSILLAGITIVKSKKTFLIFIDNSFSTKARTSRYVTNIDNIKNDAILAIENLNTKFTTLGESVTTCPVYMDRKSFELLASILRHPKIFILAFIGLASIVAGLAGTELYNLLVDLLCK